MCSLATAETGSCTAAATHCRLAAAGRQDSGVCDADAGPIKAGAPGAALPPLHRRQRHRPQVPVGRLCRQRLMAHGCHLLRAWPSANHDHRLPSACSVAFCTGTSCRGSSGSTRCCARTRRSRWRCSRCWRAAWLGSRRWCLLPPSRRLTGVVWTTVVWTTCAAIVQHLHNLWQLLDDYIEHQAQIAGTYRTKSLNFDQRNRPCCRVFTFLSATDALAGRCVEFSSLVSPAVRAAHLAAFRAGRVQVLRPVTVASLWPHDACNTWALQMSIEQAQMRAAAGSCNADATQPVVLF